MSEAAAALVRLEGRAAAAGRPADLRVPGADVVAKRAAPGPVVEHLYRHEVVMPAAATAESARLTGFAFVPDSAVMASNRVQTVKRGANDGGSAPADPADAGNTASQPAR